MIDIFNICLVVLVLGLAAWTILAREAIAAVLGFLAYGLLLSLAWVQLQGIDVALIEAAIGGGLTGVLMIGAASKLRSGDKATGHDVRCGPATRLLAALLSVGATLTLAGVVLALPTPAPTLAPEVAARMAAIEVGNPITAVLLGFRALDTLLEAIVLLFALLGVWSLTPDGFWNGRPGGQQHADPNGMLTYMARVLPPLGIVVGTYIFWVGADFPGGKFQGASILAAMWLLVLMAGLVDAPPLSRRWLRGLLVAGPLVFIAIGVVGIRTGGAFLAYPQGFAKPLILVIEFALLPTLTLVLGLMLLGPPQRSEVP